MKLAAFTLYEVVIALTVLSIVSALTYKGFSYLAMGSKTYINNTSQHLQLLGFANRLELDLFNANQLRSTQNQGFTLLNYNNRTIQYHLRGDYLVRIDQTPTDSIAVLELTHSPLKSPIQGSNQLISQLNITIEVLNTNVSLHYFMAYYPNQFINTP